MKNLVQNKLSQIYIAFSRAFDYPSSDFWLEEGNIKSLLLKHDRKDLYNVSSHSLSPSLMEQLKDEYVNCFDVGGNGTPPCPLYEGLCRKDEDRVGIIMDLLRFYNFFDLKLSQSRRDYPDHLSTELEFMSYLASLEAQAEEEGIETTPSQLAQRDFLNRHLDIWLPLLHLRLTQYLESTIYHDLCLSLMDFIKEQRVRLDFSLRGGVNEHQKD